MWKFLCRYIYLTLKKKILKRSWFFVLLIAHKPSNFPQLGSRLRYPLGRSHFIPEVDKPLETAGRRGGHPIPCSCLQQRLITAIRLHERNSRYDHPRDGLRLSRILNSARGIRTSSIIARCVSVFLVSLSLSLSPLFFLCIAFPLSRLDETTRNFLCLRWRFYSVAKLNSSHGYMLVFLERHPIIALAFVLTC